MRYLVTGCAGFIGSTLTDRLLDQGHEVVGIDCFTPYYAVERKQENLRQALDHGAFTLHQIDLATDDIPADAVAVDGVFHQAAQAGVRASWGDEFSTYTNCNVLATQRLLEAVVRAHDDAPPRVVYASSSSIYGDALQRPTREDALPAPVSPYGVTKLSGEHLCHTYHRNYGLSTASLRYFTVYGERQRPDMAMHRFLRAAITGGRIDIYGDGSQSRDFTYVGDIVAANIAAMGAPNATGAFNIGGGTITTVRDVLEMVAELTGSDLNVQYLPTERGDVRHTSADTSRAQQELSFTPAVDIRTGLGRELSWLRSVVPTG